MEHQKCEEHGIKNVVHYGEIFITWYKLYGEITAILITIHHNLKQQQIKKKE